jgi:Secretion system C-terminal sorting domain
MKTIVLFLAIACLLPVFADAQTMRYFQVGVRNEFVPDARDTSYVVATDNPTLIAEALAELAKPVETRLHINGYIAAGNGGFNKSGDFWYSWHIKPNEWLLAEISILLCNGLPYTDVERDTAGWLQTIGQLCNWSSCIMREIPKPVGLDEPGNFSVTGLALVPNPATTETSVSFFARTSGPATITLTDILGRPLRTETLIASGRVQYRLDTANLPDGIYFVSVGMGGTRRTQRLIVNW